MNYKISLAALAVASVVSGQAMAALTATETTALGALAANSTWTASNWDTSLDGTTLSNTVDWGTSTDACTWRGIVCASGEITHVEIPNSGITATMDATLAAIAPAAASLLVLNISTTATPANVHTGSMAGLAGFTSLTHLAINGTNAEGIIPDLSAATSLNWVNVYGNSGITGMAGKLAGGSAITLIGANDNPNMSGDMTSTLANTTPPATVTLNNSKLYGTMVIAADDVVALTGTDIVPTGDATKITASGYDATTVVQPASGVTVTGGEESAMVNWTAPTAGEQTGYSVSYTSNGGVTLEGTTAVTGATTNNHNFTGIPAGTYKAVVQSTGPDSRMSGTALSGDFTVTAAAPTPPVCVAPQVLNAASDACIDPVDPVGPEEPAAKKSGGAALWLVLLPLMGLFRRKRA